MSTIIKEQDLPFADIFLKQLPYTVNTVDQANLEEWIFIDGFPELSVLASNIIRVKYLRLAKVGTENVGTAEAPIIKGIFEKLSDQYLGYDLRDGICLTDLKGIKLYQLEADGVTLKVDEEGNNIPCDALFSANILGFGPSLATAITGTITRIHNPSNPIIE